MTAPHDTQTATPPTMEDFLLGGGESRKGRSLSFKTIGTTHTGTITAAPEVRQQRDPDDGSLKTWDNGDPVWQIVVPIQTTLRSAEVEDDDGMRYLYVSGSKKPESRSMHVAVADAVRAAGAKGLEVGGQLTITYTADGPKKPGASVVRNAPKQYQASYVPAANAALMGGSETGGNAAQAAAPQQQAAVPAQQDGEDPALTEALSKLPAEQAAAFRAAGLDLTGLRAMGLQV